MSKPDDYRGSSTAPSSVRDQLASRWAHAVQYLEPVMGDRTIGNSPRFWLGFSVAVSVLLIYPLTTNPYRILSSTVLFIWVLLGLSVTVIWGYTGIFSFGQTAFFGLGGYIFGVVGINMMNITGATNLALVAAVIGPAIFAGLMGYFMFYGRVSGIYVAIITFATTLILALLFSQTAGSAYTIGDAALGGYNGMLGIPTMTLGIQPIVYKLGPLAFYYFMVLVLVLVYFGLRYLLNSNFGYVMVAIREDQERTELFGYDIRKVKLQVFCLGGALAGASGGLYASWGNYISPPIMGIAFAALPILWVIVGGRKTILGAIVGTVALRYIETQLAIAGSEFATIFMGILLIVVVLFLPQGAVPSINRWLSKHQDGGGEL